MKPFRTLIIVCGLLFMASCTPYYYTSLEGVEKVPCFGPESVAPYNKKAAGSTEGEISSALSRVNGIYTGKHGIYNFVFSNSYDWMNPLRCDKFNPVPDSNLMAHVNVFAQPLSETGPGAIKKKKQEDSQEDSGESSEENSEGASEKGKAEEKKEKKQKQQSETTGGTEDSAASASVGDMLSQKIQLVISSYLYSLSPADRLETVYTLITPLDGGVEFIRVESPEAGISRTSVALGKETSTTKLPLSGIDMAGVGFSPSLETSLERQIAKQFITLNVEVFPLRNILMISQDGGPAKASIGGNVEVETTISLPPDLCKYYEVLQYQKADGNKEGMYEAHPVCYIDKVPALAASFSLVRAVTMGQKTAKEDDDTIKYFTFRNASVVDLWRNPVRLYGIKYVPYKDAVNKKELLVFREPDIPLVLQDFEEALTLRRLMASADDKKIKVNKKNKDLSVNGTAKNGRYEVCVFKSEVPDLSEDHIETAHDRCPEP